MNPPKWGFSEFFAILGCGAHRENEFSLKLLEMDQDNPKNYKRVYNSMRQPAYEIILMLSRVS